MISKMQIRFIFAVQYNEFWLRRGHSLVERCKTLQPNNHVLCRIPRVDIDQEMFPVFKLALDEGYFLISKFFADDSAVSHNRIN